jgi:hypothetical protein
VRFSLANVDDLPWRLELRPSGAAVPMEPGSRVTVEWRGAATGEWTCADGALVLSAPGDGYVAVWSEDGAVLHPPPHGAAPAEPIARFGIRNARASELAVWSEIVGQQVWVRSEPIPAEWIGTDEADAEYGSGSLILYDNIESRFRLWDEDGSEIQTHACIFWDLPTGLDEYATPFSSCPDCGTPLTGRPAAASWFPPHARLPELPSTHGTPADRCSRYYHSEDARRGFEKLGFAGPPAMGGKLRMPASAHRAMRSILSLFGDGLRPRE